MLQKVQKFLENEHTALEKGLMISVGCLSGIIIGFFISPIKYGFKMWSDIGSYNGCNNDSKTAPPPLKPPKKNFFHKKLKCLKKTKKNSNASLLP
ncbi:hypothetical protein CG709_13680 [Lachnotalea glycerini]|nr:hypothetical protein CG709_13680 [Lachnotalea glycerini]RDY32268.1 hypothetical protein CG710_004600 [Lachnotalea glycerini]